MDENKIVKGLGDYAKDIIEKTNLDYIAKAYEKLSGKDCGCGARKDFLNQFYSGHKDIQQYTKFIAKPDVPGRPFRKEWYKVRGLNNPIVQAFIQKAQKLDWGNHNLWFVGGILHDWFTKDIDCVITGPYEPEKIHNLQFKLISSGFNVGLFPDVIYTDENWDHMPVYTEWLKSGKTINQKWYYSHNQTVINNDKIYCFRAEGIERNSDGFWVKDLQIPYKNMQKKYAKRNYVKSPLKII